jgi:hypothetical protein
MWSTAEGNKRKKDSTIAIFGLHLDGAATIIILGPTILLGLFDQMTLTLALVGILFGFLVPLIYLMLGQQIKYKENGNDESMS